MLKLPSHWKVFLASEPCDMRKQGDGLAALVQQGMGRDVRKGDIFVFRNRRGDMVKVLFFDTQGICVLAKRLDYGVFTWKPAASCSTPLPPQELVTLLTEIHRRNPATESP